jgi:hypothetical protein
LSRRGSKPALHFEEGSRWFCHRVPGQDLANVRFPLRAFIWIATVNIRDDSRTYERFQMPIIGFLLLPLFRLHGLKGRPDFTCPLSQSIDLIPAADASQEIAPSLSPKVLELFASPQFNAKRPRNNKSTH